MFCEDRSYILNNNARDSWTNSKQNTTSSFERGSMMSQQLVSQDAQNMQAMLEQSPTSPTETTTLNQANGKKKTKPKRTRTAYTSTQLMQLEAEFQNGRYLCRARRIQISASLSLTEKQIKVWFQNRRMKDKKDNKCDINLLMSNNQTELAGYLRNTSTCNGKHIFNMTTDSPKSATSMIPRNNNVQTSMPNLSCTYPSDMSQDILQNGPSAMPDYGIIDQQQLQQAEQNYLSAIVPQTQISYNVLPDHTPYSHQQQRCHSQQQQLTDYTTSHYPQLNNSLLQQEPQIDNNLLQQQWKYEDMQNNSDPNSYAQVQNDYADISVTSNIANDISNQIMSNHVNFMPESEENCLINNVPSLPSFLSCFIENLDQ